MHHALLMGVGLTLTTLLLFLPALHMRATTGLELQVHHLAFVLLPVSVLLLALAYKREWIRLWLFPCSHLLALATIPQLSSPKLYHGLEGLGAFGALLLVGGLYISVAIKQTPAETQIIPNTASEEPRPQLELPPDGLTMILAALIFGSFMAGIFLEPGDDRLSAVIASLAGLVTTWLVLGRLWYPRVLLPLSNPKERGDLIEDVSFIEQIGRPQFITTTFIVVLTLSMLLVFHGIM